MNIYTELLKNKDSDVAYAAQYPKFELTELTDKYYSIVENSLTKVQTRLDKIRKFLGN